MNIEWLSSLVRGEYMQQQNKIKLNQIKSTKLINKSLFQFIIQYRSKLISPTHVEWLSYVCNEAIINYAVNSKGPTQGSCVGPSLREGPDHAKMYTHVHVHSTTEVFQALSQLIYYYMYMLTKWKLISIFTYS